MPKAARYGALGSDHRRCPSYSTRLPYMAPDTLGKHGVGNCCKLTGQNTFSPQMKRVKGVSERRCKTQSVLTYLPTTATVKEAVTYGRYIAELTRQEHNRYQTALRQHVQRDMSTQIVSARIEQLRQNLEWSHQVSRETCRVLDQYCTQMSNLERTVQPVVSKTQSLIQTRENIKQARAQAEEVLEHLDASRKVVAL